MNRYMLILRTQNTHTSQNMAHSDDLQILVDTADYMKNKLYKDQTITVVDIATGKIMHRVERW